MLFVQQHLEQHRRQVLGDGHAVPLGLLPEGGHGAEAHGDVEGIEGLRRAVVLVGLLPPLFPPGADGGIAAVGVLPLLLPGRLLHVQDAVGVGDVMSQLPQVHRQQGLEEHQGAAAVADGVEYLQGNAPVVDVEPHQPAVVLPEAHRLAGVGDVLLHEGAGGRVRLKVIPEGPLPDAHAEGGEAGHGLVHRPLEGRPIHLLRHHRRKPVDGGVLLLLQGGIEHRRVVQGIPLPRRLGHLPPPSLQSGFHNYITLSRSPQGETPRRGVGTEKYAVGRLCYKILYKCQLFHELALGVLLGPINLLTFHGSKKGFFHSIVVRTGGL